MTSFVPLISAIFETISKEEWDAAVKLGQVQRGWFESQNVCAIGDDVILVIFEDGSNRYVYGREEFEKEFFRFE